MSRNCNVCEASTFLPCMVMMNSGSAPSLKAKGFCLVSMLSVVEGLVDDAEDWVVAAVDGGVTSVACTGIDTVFAC